MDGIVAQDPRVGAILKTPDEYFARARRKAWLEASRTLRPTWPAERNGDGTRSGRTGPVEG